MEWSSAAGVAMTVITSVIVLVVTASFITIFVKREHFVVKASSFLFTGTMISTTTITHIMPCRSDYGGHSLGFIHGLHIYWPRHFVAVRAADLVC